MSLRYNVLGVPDYCIAMHDLYSEHVIYYESVFFFDILVQLFCIISEAVQSKWGFHIILQKVVNAGIILGIIVIYQLFAVSPNPTEVNGVPMQAPLIIIRIRNVAKLMDNIHHGPLIYHNYVSCLVKVEPRCYE